VISDSTLTPTRARFRAISDLGPGLAIEHLWQESAQAYLRWYLRDGEARRPDYTRGLNMLKAHMPELVPTYERLLVRCVADELSARFLSLYDPPAFVAGCSQGVWTRDRSALVRNYDFPASLCESVLLQSNWNGTRVMAMSDCLWGVLDGMNEHGLAVSLAYGGRRVLDRGFAITLVLRYLLEFCQTVKEAVSVLKRIPVQMSYNVTALDRQGEFVTVMLSPDKEARITHSPRATNHQNPREVALYETLADSRVREQFIASRQQDPRQNYEHFLQLFLQPPLYRTSAQAHGWGTLYTSAWYPEEGAMDILWPDGHWQQSFQQFVEQERTVIY